MHTTHRGVSSTATGGVSRCPFRAAVQSRQLHTSAVAAQLSPSPSPAVLEEEKKKQTASVSQKQEGGLPKEVQCGVKRATKDGQCECAAQGLQPIGEPYNLSNTAHNTMIYLWWCAIVAAVCNVFCSGNCPFRWSKFVKDTVKETVQRTIGSTITLAVPLAGV